MLEFDTWEGLHRALKDIFKAVLGNSPGYWDRNKDGVYTLHSEHKGPVLATIKYSGIATEKGEALRQIALFKKEIKDLNNVELLGLFYKLGEELSFLDRDLDSNYFYLSHKRNLVNREKLSRGITDFSILNKEMSFYNACYVKAVEELTSEAKAAEGPEKEKLAINLIKNILRS